MNQAEFDYTKADAMAMPVTPMDPPLSTWRAMKHLPPRLTSVTPGFSAKKKASPSGNGSVSARCFAINAAI